MCPRKKCFCNYWKYNNTYVVTEMKREMSLEMQLVDSLHVPRTALTKFLVVPRVQHYFHNPFRRFLSPDARVTCEPVWMPPKMPAKGGAQISGRGGAAAWETKEPCSASSLILTSTHYLSSSLSLSPYLSTSASIDPPPATAELPPPRKASALGAYTSVDSGFSLHPPTVYVEEEGCRSSSCRAERCFVFLREGRRGICRKNNLTRIKNNRIVVSLKLTE